ncbi:MAG: hypothetical protein JRN39_04080 [Nitrososphaerota archaeon]|nr:hypothetical protein [Nitrososphaerota archaeon]MDG6939563.1 hypothetical protein [Nitrososphaerota archaeon]
MATRSRAGPTPSEEYRLLISVDSEPKVARALAAAMRLPGGPKVSVTRTGMEVVIVSRTASEARASMNTNLRLLKAAMEAIGEMKRQ